MLCEEVFFALLREAEAIGESYPHLSKVLNNSAKAAEIASFFTRASTIHVPVCVLMTLQP
jgi:hypothetical protein